MTVAGTQTLQNFDTIDGGAGTDSLTATLTGGTVAPTLTSVENIFARSVTGASELDLQNATGVEQVWTDRSQNDLTVSNLDSLSTIGAQNIARSTGHTYTVRYDANTVAAADTQAIVLNNAALNLAVEQGAVGAELNTVRNVSIASEGDANAVTFISDTAVETNLVDSAAVQNITITGAADLTVASQDDGTNTTALTAGTIDASEATGDVSITIADAAGTNLATGVTQRTVTMGAGDDIVDASGANLANSKIVGGEGRDTIIVDGASTTLVDDLVANVSGFEVLNLAGLTQTVSAATMGNIGFESIVATNANTGSVTNLTAESDLTLVNTNAGADSITLSVAGAATNDNAELNFATVGANGNNSTFNVTVADVENLNVSTSATDADTFRSTELSVTSTELENLTVTGNEAVIFDGTGNTALKSVDVSGVTASNATDGDLTADITVDDGVTVTGSAGDDKITFGESNEITGGAGEDVFVASIVSVTAAGAPLFSTITDLKANEDDSIEFGAAGTVLSTATTGTDVNIITEADLGLAPGVNATFANFLNAASELTAGTVSGFEFAGNAYVVQDNEGTATTFNAATDFIVELTGSVDLTEFTYA